MQMFVFHRNSWEKKCNVATETLLSCALLFFAYRGSTRVDHKRKGSPGPGAAHKTSPVWFSWKSILHMNRRRPCVCLLTPLYPCELFCLGEAVSDHKHSEAPKAVPCPLSHRPLIAPAPSTPCAPGLNPFTCMGKGLSLHGSTSKLRASVQL